MRLPRIKGAKVVKYILAILFYCCFAIILTFKLARCTPWIGADTYPIYPRGLDYVMTVLVSPWNFYLGRTVLDGGLPLIFLLKVSLYSIFKKYAEYAIVVLWLSLAGYGFYLLSKFIVKDERLCIVSGLIYMTSAFTWHESVHSIYGMLGAYAITPFLSYLTLKIMIVVQRVKLIETLAFSFLLGCLMGMLAISILFPFYSIYVIFIWLPACISALTYPFYLSRRRLVLYRLALSLVVILLGFLIPYLISYVALSLTSQETVGLIQQRQLLQVKKADFSYNYEFNNLPLALWFIYPWSFINKILCNNIATCIYDALSILVTTYGIFSILSNMKKENESEESYLYRVYTLLGFVIVATYMVIATNIVKSKELMNALWSNAIIAILLSGVTQPIKIGIPASLFSSALTFTALINIIATLKFIKKSINIVISNVVTITLLVILSILLTSTFVLYSVGLPIAKKYEVNEEFNHSLTLLNDYQEKMLFEVFTPRIYIERGKNFLDFLRYYYTYAIALRPYEPWGSYVKRLNIARMFKQISEDAVTANIVAKSLYIGAYINVHRILNVFNFMYSPIYIVIPCSLEPYNESYYMIALTALAKVLSTNNSLTHRYLDSILVFDVVPKELCERLDCIHVIVKEVSGSTKKQALEYVPRPNTIIVLVKGVNVNKIIYNETFLDYIDRLITHYDSIKIMYEFNYMPLRLHVTLNIRKSEGKLESPSMLIRFNEYYSPYWQCDKCDKIRTISPFNIFLVKFVNREEIKVDIYHKLWKDKLILIIVKGILLILGIMLLSKIVRYDAAIPYLQRMTYYSKRKEILESKAD